MPTSLSNAALCAESNALRPCCALLQKPTLTSARTSEQEARDSVCSPDRHMMTRLGPHPLYASSWTPSMTQTFNLSTEPSDPARISPSCLGSALLPLPLLLRAAACCASAGAPPPICCASAVTRWSARAVSAACSRSLLMASLGVPAWCQGFRSSRYRRCAPTLTGPHSLLSAAGQEAMHPTKVSIEHSPWLRNCMVRALRLLPAVSR